MTPPAWASRAGLLVLAAAFASCSNAGKDAAPTAPSAASAGAPDVPAAPERVARVCAQLAPAHGFSVLCPHRLPGRRGTAAPYQVSHRDLALGRCSYLLDVNEDVNEQIAPVHVLVGGTTNRYSLATRAGLWPRRLPKRTDDALRLIGARPLKPGDREASRVRAKVMRRSKVRDQKALILRIEPYPTGGLHGGHLVVLFNRATASYAVSLHWSDARLSEERVEQLLVSAESMRSVPTQTSGQPC